MSALLTVQRYDEVRHTISTLRDADTPGWWILLNQSEGAVLSSEGVGKLGVSEFSTFLLDDGCVHVVLIVKRPPERKFTQQLPQSGSSGSSLKSNSVLITYVGPNCRVSLQAAHEAHSSPLIRSLLPNLQATLFTREMDSIEPFVAFAEAGCPSGESALAKRFHHPGARILLVPLASGGFAAYGRKERHFPAGISTLLKVRRAVRKDSPQDASVTGILRSLDEIAQKRGVQEHGPQGSKAPAKPKEAARASSRGPSAAGSPARRRESKIPRLSSAASSDPADRYFTPQVKPRAATIDRAGKTTQARRPRRRVPTPRANINLPGAIRVDRPTELAELAELEGLEDFLEDPEQGADDSMYPDAEAAVRKARERLVASDPEDTEDAAPRKMTRNPRRAMAPPAHARPAQGFSPSSAAGKKTNYEVSLHENSEEDSDRLVEQLIGSLIPAQNPLPSEAQRARRSGSGSPTGAVVAAHMRSFTRSPHRPAAPTPMPEAASEGERSASTLARELPGNRLGQRGRREKKERQTRKEKKDRRRTGGKSAKSAGGIGAESPPEGVDGSGRAVVTADGSPPGLGAAPAKQNQVFLPPAAREALRELASRMDSFLGQRRLEKRLAMAMDQAVDGFELVARFAGNGEDSLARDVQTARESLKRAAMALVVTTASDRGILGSSFEETLRGIEPYLPSGGVPLLHDMVCGAKKKPTLDSLLQDGERWCSFLQRLM